MVGLGVGGHRTENGVVARVYKTGIVQPSGTFGGAGLSVGTSDASKMM